MVVQNHTRHSGPGRTVLYDELLEVSDQGVQGLHPLSQYTGWEKVPFNARGGGCRNERSFQRFPKCASTYQICIKGMVKKIAQSEARRRPRETQGSELGINLWTYALRRIEDTFEALGISDDDQSFVVGMWERLTGIELLQDGETSQIRNL